MAKVPPQRIDHPPLAAAPPPAPPALAPSLPSGIAVGRFILDRVLHESAQGFVYLAHDSQGVAWVLKEFCPRALAMRMEDGSMRARRAGEAITMSVAREAFRDESTTLSRLAVPGLVGVTDSLTAYHTLFRVMPLVAGQSLTTWVRSREKTPSVRALRALVEGLLVPLAALHAAGLLHGHVDPEQMLVAGPPGQPSVVLLGFGNVMHELGSAPGEPWAAPEVVRADRETRITTAADLYSVAACAWYAATGELPPAASRRAEGNSWSASEGLEVLIDEPGDPPSWRAGLMHAIEGGLAMAPEARPQRVADMRRLLAGETQVRLVSSQPAPLWVGEAPDPDEQRQSGQLLAAALPRAGTVSRRVEVAERVPPPGTETTRSAHAPQSETNSSPRSRRWVWPLGIALLALAIAAWWWGAGGRTPRPAAVGSPPAAMQAQPAVDTALDARNHAAVPAGASAPVVVPASSPSDPPTALPAAVAATGVALATAAAAATGPRADSPRPRVATRSRVLARRAPARLCAGKTQFALVYCLQEQCSKQALQSHPQCVAARRAGDVR